VRLRRRQLLAASGALFAARAPAAHGDPTGLSAGRLAELSAQAAARPDLRAVAVLRGGKPVFDYLRADLRQDGLHETASVTKSVLSMLVGQALSQGRIAGLDTPVEALLPDLAGVNADPRVQRLELRHLLTMTAGFQATERRFIDARARDRFAIGRRFEADPGTRFRYDNPSADLLAAALARSVGETVATYAGRQLFEPLGIDAFDWGVDEQGRHQGYSGLQLRVQDMARLGQLMLQQGQWEGRRLLEADYLRSATTAQNGGGPPVNLPYGYLWWVAPGGAPRPAFVASGFGGQFIWVEPASQLVIATAAEPGPGSAARQQALELIRGQLLPALVVP
jgi:CubicO group peptidase (beta-lactamase class C family)